ncbi:MAG TPA: divalent-cation tolerance protein CutA [Verrucomicrobiae bacterium]|nr:divalent-cation tolerance protein CutA [Verrucomicrobiae bacterium]
MTDVVVGMVTCATRVEARRIARAILTKKLAACVNVVDGLESYYWWQGKLERARECLLLIKTTRARIPAVTKTVNAVHSYEVPEVIFVPVAAGDGRYLKWVGASTKGKVSC